MNKRLLAIFAHPDDESFGPGGTLAKYAKEGVEIHILCATKGEAGRGTGDIRGQELISAAKILGVKKVDFLDYTDGELSNSKYHEIAEKIITKINDFKPQVLMTYDIKGNSGHLDHIAMALMTTYVFLHQKIAQRLFYYCRPKFYGLIEEKDKAFRRKYFIYFPEGYSEEEISVKSDVNSIWKTKVLAMKEHKSQLKDVRRIIRMYQIRPKVENFLLFDEEKEISPKKLNDMFEGIEGS